MPTPRSTARSRRPAAATPSSAREHCLFATDAPFDAEQGRVLIRQTLAAIEALEITAAERR